MPEDAIKKYMDNNLIGDMYQQGRTAFADKIHEETSIFPTATERQNGKLPHVSPICLIRIPLDDGKQYQSCMQVQTARKHQGRYIKGKKQVLLPRPTRGKKKTAFITN